MHNVITTVERDRFHSAAYECAKSWLVQEARSLPGVGCRLAEKIWEIVESGKLRRLDELTSEEETKSLELFTNVWGAGYRGLCLFYLISISYKSTQKINKITNKNYNVHFLTIFTFCHSCHPAATSAPLPQPKLVLDLATPEGCKAELTWVMVISNDSSPAKDGHLSQK